MLYSKAKHQLSSRRACRLFSLRTSVFYYQKVRKDEDDKIRFQLIALSNEHQTWGFWMMHYRLRNLGFTWNHKRVYRIYTSMKLNLRNKRKKRLPARIKEPLLRPIYPNVTWSMDFMNFLQKSGQISLGSIPLTV